MTTFRIVSFALIGLVVGSFLTVVVHRVPRHESIVAPRSRCPRCGMEIGARDNVPVVSYLLLRGRCRSCGLPIPVGYPLLEAATGALFAAAAAKFPQLATAVLLAAFFAVMVALTVIDVEHRILPNRIVVPGLLGFAVLLPAAVGLGARISLAAAGIGLAAYGGGLLVIALIAPGGMGMGDVKLGALIGLVVGALGLDHVAVAAGAAILGGGVGAVAALLFAGAGRKSALPFGPYMAGGALVGSLAANPITHWYLAHLV